MTLFRTMINTVQDESSLQHFILQNIHHFHTLSHSGYEKLVEEKDDIRLFIESKAVLLENLDYTLSQTRAFISILFDFCEVFGFLATSRIENTLNKRELYIGKRREAAKLFLLNIKNNDNYINRFARICELIEEAVEEEATDLDAIVTFANYFLKITRDTNPRYINELKEHIDSHKNGLKFLQHPLIADICEVDIQDVDSAEIEIIKLIESYKSRFIYPRGTGFSILLVEEDTDYAKEIGTIDPSFDEIRNIASRQLNGKNTRLEGRGVLPLNTFDELCVYLYSYGKMHKAKLWSAFEKIPFKNISNPVEIIDWGCGQGLASFVLKEYLDENRIELDITSITLIEPSELTLKRASLHTQKIYPNTKIIKTVCKDFNSLIPQDVDTTTEVTKIHLFSNILDLNDSYFSQSTLIRLIEETQKGENYFICVSPYITDSDSDRVDAFKRHFEQFGPMSFTNIYEVENTGKLSDPYWNCNNNHMGRMNFNCNHKANGCGKKWTRIIRVFKVNL